MQESKCCLLGGKLKKCMLSPQQVFWDNYSMKLCLQNLLECQFDTNLKFKDRVNELPPDDMRFLPIGRDKHGLAYWFMLVCIKFLYNLITIEQTSEGALIDTVCRISAMFFKGANFVIFAFLCMK